MPSFAPRGKGDPAYQVIDGVELYKYRPYAPGGSKVSFIAEYAYSFLATAWLTSLKAAGRPFRRSIQACNPPDIFWPLGLPFTRWQGARFVFDHHDLCPELSSRVPDGPQAALPGAAVLERCTTGPPIT